MVFMTLPMYIQPIWLSDIDTTAINFTVHPGVPDIKFYLQVKRPIDIQNARYVLGVRVFQKVSALETMLDWVGMDGLIREKVLLNWYQRIARMQAEIEAEYHPMPVALGTTNGVELDSDEYDDEQDCDHEIVDYDPDDVASNAKIKAFVTNQSVRKEAQCNQHQNNNNNIIKPATMIYNFWPLLNLMLIRDMNALRLMMNQHCPHVNCEINWYFLLCNPCTDLAVMIYLYAMSVWHSRPDPTDCYLSISIVWSLAIQFRDIVPCEELLTKLEMSQETEKKKEEKEEKEELFAEP
ncbi:hypothetical protein TSTA_028660 [Talaromyces stipitatus ATCC 10500]|uniref:Uncharacterized protein n=1 Tax=Talaromyces stipitatus (strain ATCC 10500 / CBS 375.48 / QM 6759 / NRRL 1006) TaxID=441959 RepID=B8M7N0_TALSN|nr:uncharacterized protein TSTA_028660 [Talaromyces stipitatus ATCC 10500]EED19583.1 hypothetical protein TSTA_028660 [Talaromyces stipitatus ATCC 10500]